MVGELFVEPGRYEAGSPEGYSMGEGNEYHDV
jgi:hypothetical protein